MLKKILISSLILVAAAAVATSLYNTILLPSMQVQAAPPAGQGNGPAWQESTDVPVQQQVPQQTLNEDSPPAANLDPATRANTSQGNGNRFGGQNQVQAAVNDPQPQNGLTEWLTYRGTVSDLEAPFFNLRLADGQVIPVELGSLSYLNQLGLSVQNGDNVTVTGFWDANGALTSGQITLASGESFSLRDELGRPSWRGGPGRGGQGNGEPTR